MNKHSGTSLPPGLRLGKVDANEARVKPAEALRYE